MKTLQMQFLKNKNKTLFRIKCFTKAYDLKVFMKFNFLMLCSINIKFYTLLNTTFIGNKGNNSN